MECVLRAAVLFFDGDTSELSHIRVLLGTDETEIARDFFREKNKERRHWSLVQDGGGSRELDEKQRAFTEGAGNAPARGSEPLRLEGHCPCSLMPPGASPMVGS